MTHSERLAGTDWLCDLPECAGDLILLGRFRESAPWIDVPVEWRGDRLIEIFRCSACEARICEAEGQVLAVYQLQPKVFGPDVPTPPIEIPGGSCPTCGTELLSTFPFAAEECVGTLSCGECGYSVPIRWVALHDGETWPPFRARSDVGMLG